MKYTLSLLLVLTALGTSAFARVGNGAGGHFSQECSSADGKVFVGLSGVTITTNSEKTVDFYPPNLNVPEETKATINLTEVSTVFETPGHRITVKQVSIQKDGVTTDDIYLNQRLARGMEVYVICNQYSFGSPVPAHN